MKIRLGFVSNSSSASFIISFDSDLDEEKIAEYIKKSDSFVEKRWDKNEIEILDFESIRSNSKKYKKIKTEPWKEHLKKNNNHYYLNVYTSMFNDWRDVFTCNFIRACSENKIDGISNLKIIQNEEEYDECNKEVQFDKMCWESEFEKNWEYIQNRIDAEYLEYLYSINIKLSEKELLLLAKYQLNK